MVPHLWSKRGAGPNAAGIGWGLGTIFSWSAARLLFPWNGEAQRGGVPCSRLSGQDSRLSLFAAFN